MIRTETTHGADECLECRTNLRHARALALATGSRRVTHDDSEHRAMWERVDD